MSQRHTSQVNHNAHKPSAYGKHGHHHLWNSKSSNNIPVVSYLHSFFYLLQNDHLPVYPVCPQQIRATRLLGNLLKFRQTSARTLVGAMSSMLVSIGVTQFMFHKHRNTHRRYTKKKKHIHFVLPAIELVFFVQCHPGCMVMKGVVGWVPALQRFSWPASGDRVDLSTWWWWWWWWVMMMMMIKNDEELWRIMMMRREQPTAQICPNSMLLTSAD